MCEVLRVARHAQVDEMYETVMLGLIVCERCMEHSGITGTSLVNRLMLSELKTLPVEATCMTSSGLTNRHDKQPTARQQLYQLTDSIWSM